MDKLLKRLDLQEIKNKFAIMAIGFFAIDALIGIMIVLSILNTSHLIGQIAATTSILGLFCSIIVTNCFRLADGKKGVRVAAIVAVIAVFVCLIPWLIMVWDGFDFLKKDCVEPSYHNYYSYYRGGGTHGRESYEDYDRALRSYKECTEPYKVTINTTWKIINFAGIIAAVATLFANFLKFTDKKASIKVMSIVTLTLASILAFVEIMIVSLEIDVDLIRHWRLFLIMGILLIFGLLVTPILVKKNEKNHVTKNDSATDDKSEPNKDELRRQIELELRPQIEKELRKKIEKEVREEIEAEMHAQQGDDI